MNFLPTYAESPPKANFTVEQSERKVQSDKSKTARAKRQERKEPIANLDWSSNGLTSLDSLNLFPDLLTLNLSDNQIYTLTPDFSPGLVILNLSSNYIERIENLFHLTQLQILNLSNNSISHIEGLQGLKNLESLDLSHNNIVNVTNLAANGRLKKLVLAHNNIDTCPNLLQNKSLQVLDLSYNKIRTTLNMNDFFPNQLKSLYLGHNKIMDLLSPLFLLFFDQMDDVDFAGNPFIEYMRKERVDYRAFIVFITQERINYLNHSPVTNDEVLRSRKFFIDEAGKFQKDLFNRLIAEEGNRDELIEYLKLTGAARRSVQTERAYKTPDTVNNSFMREYSTRPLHDTPPDQKPNESFLNESMVRPYVQTMQPMRKRIYEEEKKGAEYVEEKMTGETMQIFAQLHKEVQDLKKAMVVMIKRQKEKEKDKEVAKPKMVKEQPQAKMPPYIMTIDFVNVSRRKKKLPKSLREEKAIKVQAIIRGVLVRQRLTKYRFQQYCIRKIQAYIRGFLVRKRQNAALKAGSPIKLECENCKRNETEITSLRKQVSELTAVIEECMKARIQHEKALRYLFSQVKILAGQDEKAKEKEEHKVKVGKEEKVTHEQKAEGSDNHKEKVIYFK